MRRAISPRLAMRILWNIGRETLPRAPPGTGAGRTRRAGRSRRGPCAMRPATFASISFISFIASMMQSTWPSFTEVALGDEGRRRRGRGRGRRCRPSAPRRRRGGHRRTASAGDWRSPARRSRSGAPRAAAAGACSRTTRMRTPPLLDLELGQVVRAPPARRPARAVHAGSRAGRGRTAASRRQPPSPPPPRGRGTPRSGCRPSRRRPR